MKKIPCIKYGIKHDTMLADIKSAVGKKLNASIDEIKVYTSGEVYTIEGKLIAVIKWQDKRMY